MTSYDLYSELFKRNQPIIPQQAQFKIKELRVLVAGCGSTGGAFIEGASRLGVVNYKLTEPDTYERHNLNRQFVFPSEIGINKAQAQAARLKNLFTNCESSISVDTNGINDRNADDLTTNVDVVFDAVDVTTERGMAAKLLLHEVAAQKKILVLSALDLGYNQWIRVFDYRANSEALEGRLELARSCRHPLKALVEGFCPVDQLSTEIAEEVLRLLENPHSSACQMAAPCYLLAAFTGPILLRIAERKNLPKIISFDLMRHLEDSSELKNSSLKQIQLQNEIKNRFKAIA